MNESQDQEGGLDDTYKNKFVINQNGEISNEYKLSIEELVKDLLSSYHTNEELKNA